MLNIPDRIYSQYRNSPKLKQWFLILNTIAQELYLNIEKVRNTYDLNNATSEQLDVIGRIVGIDRSYEAQIDYTGDMFGGTTQFDDTTQFTGAGYIINKKVSDLIFVHLIKAKIVKNTKDATIDSILDGLAFVLGKTDAKIIDNENMSFSIEFNYKLNSFQIFLLQTFGRDIIMIPQGVNFLGYTDTAETTFFGEGQFGGEFESFGDYFV